MTTEASSATRPLDLAIEPRTWMRLEGGAAGVAGIALFAATGGNLLFLLPLLIAPDISAAGYLAGPRAGALLYNLFHNWATSLAVLGAGVALASPALVLGGAILVAHVGLDRLAGFGLKYPTSFGDTHLGHIGR
jgi:hypothetical protein